MSVIDANELRAELARRSWSRRELAARAGLSEAYIRWVCRGAHPSERAARLILDALGPEGAARVVVATDTDAAPGAEHNDGAG